MELVFQKKFNNINEALSKIGQPTYKSANQINREEIAQLKDIRPRQSVLFNHQFLDKNKLIANSINNVKIRAIISGVKLNIRYRQLPYLIFYSDEMRQKYLQHFWDYELFFRAGIFGFTYLMSKLHYELLQWLFKHGVKYIDKFIGLFVDNDSMNKQWIGALLLSYLTYQFSKGVEKYFDIYSLYQAYKLYSDDFQSDIRNFSKSIEYFEKTVV
ncbi:hypothetical protein ABPG72_006402 [Tetrahymena utriculariae]